MKNLHDLKKLELEPDKELFNSIRILIDESKKRVATVINSELTSLYWKIGKAIMQNILGNSRAEYGKQVISNLSHQLTSLYGTGWSEKNLWHCLRIAEIISSEEILSSLRRELSWTHLKCLIYIDDSIKRDFYIEMCRLQKWSVRQLQERINSQLFERTALSRNPDELIQLEIDKLRSDNVVTPDFLLKDPYILDFLGLKDHYLEKDLEDAILRELERFLLELGAGFTFIERQKRIQLDNKDYYIDLLLYNRKIKRLVVIELKIGEFEPSYKGQMELYLRYLAKYEQEQGENPPLGIILCTGKATEQIELLELDKSGIHVAEYLTILPPKEILKEKLHRSIMQARQRLLEDKKT